MSKGAWMAERAWVDSPLSQGTSGGVSALFARPRMAERVVEQSATSGIAAWPRMSPPSPTLSPG